MMSMFSSYDLKIFYTFLLIIFIFFNKNFLFKLNFIENFSMINFTQIFKFLFKFLENLTNSNFSKNLNLFNLSTMILIFFLNFISLFFFNFSMTTQVSFIFPLSLIIWLSIEFLVAMKKFKKKISHLIPEDIPIWMIFFIFILEMISMIVRPMALSIRLIANITTGHIMITLLSMLTNNWILFGSFFLLMMSMVETIVAIIQSYIFLVLITMYYSEI